MQMNFEIDSAYSITMHTISLVAMIDENTRRHQSHTKQEVENYF